MAFMLKQTLDPYTQSRSHCDVMQFRSTCGSASSCMSRFTSSQRSKGTVFVGCSGALQNDNSLGAFKKKKCVKNSSVCKISVRKIGIVAFGSTLGIAGATLFQLFGSGGGGGGSKSGGGGGGGGDGRFNWLDKFTAYANPEDSDHDPHDLRVGAKANITKLSYDKRYKVSGIELIDYRTDKPVGHDDPFLELVTLKPGGILTRDQMQTELDNLSSCGMFESVNMDALPQQDGTLKLQITFSESEWQAAESIRCVNVGLLPQSKQPDVDFAKMTDKERESFIRSQEEEYRQRLKMTRPCILPKSVEKDITSWIRTERRVTARILQKIRDQVQKWYHDQGFACAQVVNFGNLNTKEIVCEVVEGDITDVIVQFQDKMGLPCEGNTEMDIVERELPLQLQPGYIFNIEAGKRALRSVNSLGLFANIEVNPRPDEENDGGIVVEIKLKELEHKTAEVSTEWSIAHGGSGWPTLSSIQPGGSVTFEHRNLQGLNRSLLGSVTSNNLLNPQDDLGFKLEYLHPYLDGVSDPRNRILEASCFNSRKLSPVFTGGPGIDEVPAIWVDRAGIKANITENFNRQSKLTYGVVFEEITTRDETSTICTNGVRTLPNGGLSLDGPPTTLSGTGVDRVGFFQANVTRDKTTFVNGTPVGTRTIFQVDQGLGIGSKFPIFNRHQLTSTHFLQLKKVSEDETKALPPVLVLHGRYGGCIGDLAAYDAFTLGGPYSVRGYNMGGLGACRNFLELATELRLPIWNTHTYGFVEYGTDLGSSKDLRGNPTEFFRRAGSGLSYGVGVKVGLVRAEYATDGNTGSGSLFVRFGERF